MKKVFLLLLFSALIIGCSKAPIKKSSLLSYIPKDAHIIVKINDLEKTKNELRNNSLINKNLDLSFFKYFNTLPNQQNTSKASESLLCFSPVGKNSFEYTYISKFNSQFIYNDSIPIDIVDTFSYDENTIYTIKNGKHSFYSTQIDSMLFASSSILLVENAIRQKKTDINFSSDLEKAYKISSNETGSSILINGKELTTIQESLLPNEKATVLSNFSGWISLDSQIDQDMIKIDGVAIEKDSLSSTIGIFDNLKPKENRVAEVTPVTANGYVSFTYDDHRILKRNLALAQDRNLKDFPLKLDPLLESASEIGKIYLPKDHALAFTLYDVESALELFPKNKVSSYRNIEIHAHDSVQVFNETLPPLVSNTKASYYFVYDDFLVFAEQLETLQTIIANIQNKSTLANQTAFKEVTDELTDKTSITMLGNQDFLKQYLSKGVAKRYKKEWENLHQKRYQIAALQIIKEDGYAHLHGILKKNSKVTLSSTVNQAVTTTLEAPIITRPILVKNHRSKGLDVAVQDINNNLYLISDKGSIFWKKQIDGAIMGDIQQIDIYNNGRLQLLFNTRNTLYLVDRDGKDVYPFPKRFSKPITQPVSLFDYDKNKRYRFAITQGKKITMYNTSAQVVSGFKFKGTSSSIMTSPKHIRIAEKDYILVPEENGTLHILNRVGKPRVPVKEKFDFTSNNWYKFENAFTSTTKDGKLVKIAPNGTITLRDANLNSKNDIVTTNITKVTFSENILTIKDKVIELDYGIYSKPEIFYIKNKLYVSITNIQTSQVFLYDSTGNLQPSFPVYGNSLMSLGNMDKDEALEFVVKGEENTILIYQIN